ncbi:MAG TPA: flagellar export chaperone FliS [Acidimicrobiia bacterium]|jgi:flagellar protein FliS|nr:flagellar export chaperone FliS [Acidimicrobiia bacterium]
MVQSSALNRYKTEAVATMSPARMIIALYDRLVLDFDRALDALERRDPASTHAALVHAQDIVNELNDSLDVDAWPAAASIAEIYRYLLTELLTANLEKSAARIADCRRVVEPLRDAWREAAALVPDGAA